MPNGGVPIDMVLRTQSTGHVVYCRGAEIQVFSSEEWSRSPRVPLLVLNSAEAQVLERFVRYWLQDTQDEPIYSAAGVDVEFDY